MSRQIKTRQLLALRHLEPDQLHGEFQSRGVWATQVSEWVDLPIGNQVTLLDLERWLSDKVYQQHVTLRPAGFTNFEPPQMWEWNGDGRFQYRFKPK